MFTVVCKKATVKLVKYAPHYKHNRLQKRPDVEFITLGNEKGLNQHAHHSYGSGHSEPLFSSSLGLFLCELTSINITTARHRAFF